MPQRIQRTRKKGWRMPAGAVYVGRPTKLGNPWKISPPTPATPLWFVTPIQPSIHMACRVSWMAGGALYFETERQAREFAVAMYRAWVILLVAHGDLDLDELRGKDLVDWCSLDQLCHADILLELANRENTL